MWRLLDNICWNHKAFSDVSSFFLRRWNSIVKFILKLLKLVAAFKFLRSIKSITVYYFCTFQNFVNFIWKFNFIFIAKGQISFIITNYDKSFFKAKPIDYEDQDLSTYLESNQLLSRKIFGICYFLFAACSTAKKNRENTMGSSPSIPRAPIGLIDCPICKMTLTDPRWVETMNFWIISVQYLKLYGCFAVQHICKACRQALFEEKNIPGSSRD